MQCHGSQCGFCTPGFVMSLFGMYQNHVCRGEPISRELAQEELSGNLCRCTGYRPILDAARQMAELPRCAYRRSRPAGTVALALRREAAPALGAYLAPKTLQSLLAARAAHPDAQIVAGCTDVGLWVTKMHMQFDKVLDVTGVEELRRVEHYDHHIAIGAAVTLTDAFDALIAQWPQLKTFANRFAGLPIRNSGTLGGNVANGSPIGDSMPLLIALDAHVVLMSARGHRDMPLENFYTGYRKNVLAPDEVLAWIKVPRPRGRGIASRLQDLQALRRRHLRRLPGREPQAGEQHRGEDLHRRGRRGGDARAGRQDRGRSSRQAVDPGGSAASHGGPCGPSSSRSPTCAHRPPIAARCWAT